MCPNLLEIHQTEPSSVHFQGWTASFILVLVVVFQFYNISPAVQRNVSMGALRGTVGTSITFLGHSNVVLNCEFYIGIPAYPDI